MRLLPNPLFLLFAVLCNFLICADYATIRPVSNALFLTSYGTDFFPYAWLATIPLNFLLIAWYNKYLPRWGCHKTFLVTIGLIISGNLFSALFMKHFSWLPFVFYIWKDVYIMLSFQQLWSVIHSNVAFSKAKYLYGIFYGIGAFGAVGGSALSGFLAVALGSETLLFFTVPFYLLVALFYTYALKFTQNGMQIEERKEKSSIAAFVHGFKLIRSSHLLIFILCIVVCMQLSSTLIDYQFNHFLENHIADKDWRTQYTGRILGIVHAITMALQFVGSFLFIHFLGVKRSHFLIPLALSLNALAFLAFPTFALITVCYMSVKCFDFSLFSIVKEMMYIPLKSDEKFRAKAFIDVFAYRSSKAIAAFLILGLHMLLRAELQQILTILGLCIFIFWCLLVKKMVNAEYEFSR
jgi:AAA family ATP:ADP antiporter